MDLLQEPRTLLSQVAQKFEPQSDVAAIQSINSTVEQLLFLRQSCLDALRESVRACARKVDLLRWESQRPSHLSEEVHEQKLDELERVKFILAKNIQDNEATLLELEQQIATLQAAVQDLEQTERTFSKVADVEVACRIYSLFGVQVLDSCPTEPENKVLVRGKNDVCVLAKDRYAGEAEYCNAIWQAIEGR